MKSLHKLALISATLFLTACNAVQYQPLATIDKVDPLKGYRLQQVMQEKFNDQTIVAIMFSGGGTRAAAFGYGVLEELNNHPITLDGKPTNLIDNVDMVYGVSGGSILAIYYSLYGKETIPNFEKKFLKQNFQKLMVNQTLSFANMPRLFSPEFGRGDLLQEQFEITLFGNKTFGDLATKRNGPFAVISATDMSIGRRLDFTQEQFDTMCLDLSKLPLARAVAASSAVPLVFSPLTLNNNGGNCHYELSKELKDSLDADPNSLQNESRQQYIRQLQQYANSQDRPYIHLLDGGLTDNLGIKSLLETQEVAPESAIRKRLQSSNIKRIIIISVNAQNQISTEIDKTAEIPSFSDQATAVIDVPIDQTSQTSLNRFRAVVDARNEELAKIKGDKAGIYFISLNLRDLPDSQAEFRQRMLNLPTSFYLPTDDINNLKMAAKILLNQSKEYQRLLKDAK
ncbi:patatin-like phospholipase family protein [Lonepinella sp. MS14437]|uniref:patatin-like phospholipase family protein n=1 Tax=Lonepinella sp. MS14437 TaxID=3003620 RepID=UPI0036DDFDCF